MKKLNRNLLYYVFIITVCRVSIFCSRIKNADTKGAIYLTAKNGTFPILLTSFKSHDISTTRDTSNILSVSAKNLSRDSTDGYWDESSDALFSSFVNDTYGESESNVWKSKRSINDAVSKNITLVLENLLKNYENSQLPTHGKGISTYTRWKLFE